MSDLAHADARFFAQSAPIPAGSSATQGDVWCPVAGYVVGVNVYDGMTFCSCCGSTDHDFVDEGEEYHDPARGDIGAPDDLGDTYEGPCFREAGDADW